MFPLGIRVWVNSKMIYTNKYHLDIDRKTLAGNIQFIKNNISYTSSIYMLMTNSSAINGNIYEYDIITNIKNNKTYIVFFSNDLGKYSGYDGKNYIQIPKKMLDYEIIGNILEDPEEFKNIDISKARELKEQIDSFKELINKAKMTEGPEYIKEDVGQLEEYKENLPKPNEEKFNWDEANKGDSLDNISLIIDPLSEDEPEEEIEEITSEDEDDIEAVSEDDLPETTAEETIEEDDIPEPSTDISEDDIPETAIEETTVEETTPKEITLSANSIPYEEDEDDGDISAGNFSEIDGSAVKDVDNEEEPPPPDDIDFGDISAVTTNSSEQEDIKDTEEVKEPAKKEKPDSESNKNQSKNNGKLPEADKKPIKAEEKQEKADKKPIKTEEKSNKLDKNDNKHDKKDKKDSNSDFDNLLAAYKETLPQYSKKDKNNAPKEKPAAKENKPAQPQPKKETPPAASEKPKKEKPKNIFQAVWGYLANPTNAKFSDDKFYLDKKARFVDNVDRSAQGTDYEKEMLAQASTTASLNTTDSETLSKLHQEQQTEPDFSQQEVYTRDVSLTAYLEVYELPDEAGARFSYTLVSEYSVDCITTEIDNADQRLAALIGFVEILKQVNDDVSLLEIVTSSQYISVPFKRGYIYEWAQNDWKKTTSNSKIKYSDKWQQAYKLSQQTNLNIVYVEERINLDQLVLAYNNAKTNSTEILEG